MECICSCSVILSTNVGAKRREKEEKICRKEAILVMARREGEGLWKGRGEMEKEKCVRIPRGTSEVA